MQKIKFLTLIAGVISMSLAGAYLTIAFTGPTQAPPGGNVPAPLNVGPLSQSKIGSLILNTGGAGAGLIVQHGNVGIGTTEPTARLHIAGTPGADGIRFPDGTLQTTAAGAPGATMGFGGFFTWRAGHCHPNPYTGWCSCPQGFTHHFTGMNAFDRFLFICLR